MTTDDDPEPESTPPRPESTTPESGTPQSTTPESATPASAGWMKFTGLGLELASYALGMAAIGYVVDRQFDYDKGYGVALGTLVGFAFGMYQFVRRVSQPPSRR